jgi:hypothetical protein
MKEERRKPNNKCGEYLLKTILVELMCKLFIQIGCKLYIEIIQHEIQIPTFLVSALISAEPELCRKEQ